jgi:hypothetical protein
MSKHSGARCTGIGSDCVDDPLSWCERIGNQCSGGTQGDLGIMEAWEKLSVKDFRKHTEQSPTLFMLDNQFSFIKTGLFAAAGLKEGDRLTAVCQDKRAFAVENPEELKFILTWQFTAPELVVCFNRDGEEKLEVLKNPQTKE